jgi:hypothetical protein
VNTKRDTRRSKECKKENYCIRNWGKIRMMWKIKHRKYLNNMHQMQAEKLKRTKINKKAEKIKQKPSRIDNLSKNGQVTNEIRSETHSTNMISNFLSKILGVEEKARRKIELKNEKEDETLPDSDRKTTKSQKPKSKLKKKLQKKKEMQLKKKLKKGKKNQLKKTKC